MKNDKRYKLVFLYGLHTLYTKQFVLCHKEIVYQNVKLLYGQKVNCLPLNLIRFLSLMLFSTFSFIFYIYFFEFPGKCFYYCYVCRTT